MAASRAALADWNEYLSCTPLPDPRDQPAMNDFLATVVPEVDIKDLQKTLQQCEVSVAVDCGGADLVCGRHMRSACSK